MIYLLLATVSTVGLMMYLEKASDPTQDDEWDRVDEITVFVLSWAWLMGILMTVYTFAVQQNMLP